MTVVDAQRLKTLPLPFLFTDLLMQDATLLIVSSCAHVQMYVNLIAFSLVATD